MLIESGRVLLLLRERKDRVAHEAMTMPGSPSDVYRAAGRYAELVDLEQRIAELVRSEDN